ncbi:amidohydrolase family protein [Sulfitobacter sp. JB4-11]|uniref:amidohydrolase family protein n=1 Tax=Sulfitobacter rhodophyticola TaxID=3238304 RepID=UPI0035174A48
MIDAHHHIWHQKDLPWLLGPEQPRIFGPYAAIKRDYLIDEYIADIKGTGITKSVYVQANWAPNWFADEVAWVQSVADRHGWPHGIVGYADFTVDDVRPQLEKLNGFPLMRGIRQQFHWHENPLYRFAARPDLPADRAVQKNIAKLADYGWSFDLQVFTSQMTHAAKLARACPDVTFVLQHAGMLEDTSKTGWQDWCAGMRRLAECDNVVTKLSAFGTFIHRNDGTFIHEMIIETEKIFGAKRCMFGSNYPIEKLWTSYADLFDAFQKGAAKLSKSARKSIFNDTAERVYRL